MAFAKSALPSIMFGITHRLQVSQYALDLSDKMLTIKVFTLLSTLWAQVDYRARLMMPWMLMAQEPQIATRSVLLDYISPNIITALFDAVKTKDMHVALALFGTILNKLLIIVSTGLFTFASINIDVKPTAMRGGRALSSSGFNVSLVSELPAARVFGIESLNMSYPFGITSSFATEIPPPRNGK